MLSEKIVESIVETISQYEKIVLCYLFGSSIKIDEYNDIDLGILLSNSNSIYAATKFSMEVGRSVERALNFKKVIDIKVLNHSPIYFQFEIISKGVLLFSKGEKERITYEKEVINLHLDYKDTFDWFNRQIMERV
ncbi:MAG: nucleotidyltransferase domain-containing protein [Candidatus Helarchaeota archaeon]